MVEKLDEFVDFVTNFVEPKKRPDVSLKRWHNTVLTGTKIQPPNKKTKQKPTPKKKSKRMTRTEFSNLGLFNLPTKSLKYADLVPMHDLWTQYIEKQLGPFLKQRDDGKFNIPEVYDSNYDHFSKTLVKSDLHGAKITVECSCNPSLVGQTGIVAMETRNTFKIVGIDNRIRSMHVIHCVCFVQVVIIVYFCSSCSHSEARVCVQNLRERHRNENLWKIPEHSAG